MEYRQLGRTGLGVSAVGLGTEYLLDIPGQEATRVIREAIEAGVNYFDLFYAQPAFRDTMGAAFAPRREAVTLAGHLGAIVRDGQSDKTREADLALEFIEDFLKRYRTDRVDVLFLHNSDTREDYERIMADGGLCDLAERLVLAGKARFVGFSGHTVETALLAARSGRIDVLMFPVNLAGHAVEGKDDLFSACAAAGVALVAMKPFAGGRLLGDQAHLEADSRLLGKGRRTLEKSAPVTPVQCISYALSRLGVSTVVPGCASVTELQQSLAWLDADAGERDFSRAIRDFRHFAAGKCVYCNHCLPCPARINIGDLMRLLDTARVRTTAETAARYAALAAEASDCTACGACVERCPFGADPASAMREAAELFS